MKTLKAYQKAIQILKQQNIHTANVSEWFKNIVYSDEDFYKKHENKQIEILTDPNAAMCERDKSWNNIKIEIESEDYKKCNDELRKILKFPYEQNVETNNILDKTERHARFGGWYCDISIFDNVI